MAVPYKKIARKDPRKTDAIEKFYPQLVTLGQSASLESIAYEMKEKSSLSSGDIKSVLTNFVEAMRTSLYNGQSVNIRDFGVFSLSARTKGVDTEKEMYGQKHNGSENKLSSVIECTSEPDIDPGR